MNEPLILHSDNAGEGTPLPLGLSGFPTEADGVKIHYRRVKAAKVGKWTHRGSGEEFTITPERADEWVRNTKAMSAAGVRPFIPGQHRDTFNAADNHGYVIDVERDGDDLYATLALYGDDALITAATNSRSIYVVSDALDAKGKRYAGESIAHIALVPNPALPDLGGLVRIAASAGGTVTAKMFELSTSGLAPERSPIMKPETITKLRAKLNLPDTKAVSDEEVAERAAVLALTDPPADKSAEVVALSADVTRLKAELATEKAAKETATLALSATQPKELDPMSLSLINRAFKTECEQVIASGVISEAGMKEMDLLLGVGSSKAVALSLSAGGTDPLYIRVCDILRRNPGLKTLNGVERQAATSVLALEGSGADPAKTTADARAEGMAWQKQQLAARGLAS